MPAVATQRWSDRSYSRKSARLAWDVVGAADAEEALAACPVEKNSTHPLNSRLRAEDPVAEPSGLYVWRVTAQYSIPENGEHKDQPTNPLDEPPEIQWDPGSVSEPADFDWFGNPITNSAGQPFSNPPPRDFETLFLTIRRNESRFDLDKSLGFGNTINANVFSIFVAQGVRRTVQPGQIKCLYYKPVGSYRPDSAYVNCEYHFELRRGKRIPSGPFHNFYDGFFIRARDQGTEGWYDVDGTPVLGALVDGAGQPLSTDAMLDGTGRPINTSVKVSESLATPIANPRPLPQSTTVVRSGDGAAVHLLYPDCEMANFNGLDL